jgi:hypothetical protein
MNYSAISNWNEHKNKNIHEVLDGKFLLSGGLEGFG